MNDSGNFGYDFLWSMREILARQKDTPFDGYSDSIARYLLVQFGTPVGEVDKINEIFLQRLGRDGLGDYGDALQRLQYLTKDNDYVKEYMVSSFAAVTTSQLGELSQEQRDFMYGFQGLFDMKPSQFQIAIQRGVGWATALEFVANRYAENRCPQSRK